MEINHYTELIDQIKASRPHDAALSRRLSELITLSELLSALLTTRDTHSMLELVLLTVMGEYPCGRGAVLILDRHRWETRLAKGVPRNFQVASSMPDECFFFDRDVMLEAGCTGHDGLESLLESARCSYLFPLKSDTQLVGAMILGRSLLGPLDPEKSNLIATITGFAAVVLGNQLFKMGLESLTRELKHKVFQLRNLNEISGSFSRCYDQESVYQVLSQSLMGLFLISRCAVLEGWDPVQPTFFKGLKANTLASAASKVSGIPLPSSLTSEGLVEEQDLPQCFQEFMRQQRLQFALPIMVEREFHSLLLLGRRLDGRDLSPEDRELLMALAQQAGVALENVGLHLEVVEKKRLERELELAREIQQRLLPKTTPDVEGYEIAVRMEPFSQVGGDFYDFLEVGEDAFGFCIADVSGKSLPASIIMSTTQACLRALTSYPGIHLVEIVSALNQQVWRSTQPNKFVTLFLGILDFRRHTLSYVNAGHNRPFFLSPDGQVRELDKGGMVVGLFPGAEYQTETLLFPEGASLLVFTDGLPEIQDDEGEELGEERLLTLFRQWILADGVEKAHQGIFSDVLAFGQQRMIDDMTLMLMRRKGET